jgi:hypothetical protein
MHSALFVAQLPRMPHEWSVFLSDTGKKLKNEKHAQRLSENVWLLNFEAAPSDLSWLVSTAERLGIPYGILPFDAEPRWLPAGFDPKTIQVRNVSP